MVVTQSMTFTAGAQHWLAGFSFPFTLKSLNTAYTPSSGSLYCRSNLQTDLKIFVVADIYRINTVGPHLPPAVAPVNC